MIRTGIIGGPLADRLLQRLGERAERKGYCDGSSYRGRSKLEMLFGEGIWSELSGKTVVDFGCGSGGEAIEMAEHGATSVIGIDILDHSLETARGAAEKAGVSGRCRFTKHADTLVDLVVSLDGFEHFGDPGAVLQTMARMLKPTGRVLATFGPTWLHPLGGHLFSVFPWAHLLFTERALIRWRSGFKHDGATRFGEVEGGLNQMTISRFRRLVASSPLEFETLETIPIRRLRAISNRVTREFVTSFVRCRLRPRVGR
jgi:SAM-dependent methyltransferase